MEVRPAHPHTCVSPGRLDGGGLQMGVEPADDSFDPIAHVVGALDPMSFVLVDDKLRLHAERLQCVPELVSLRERDLRSEEHTSELQSPYDLVCRLLLEKKK